MNHADAALCAESRLGVVEVISSAHDSLHGDLVESWLVRVNRVRRQQPPAPVARPWPLGRGMSSLSGSGSSNATENLFGSLTPASTTAASNVMLGTTFEPRGGVGLLRTSSSGFLGGPPRDLGERRSWRHCPRERVTPEPMTTPLRKSTRGSTLGALATTRHNRKAIKPIPDDAIDPRGDVPAGEPLFSSVPTRSCSSIDPHSMTASPSWPGGGHREGADLFRLGTRDHPRPTCGSDFGPAMGRTAHTTCDHVPAPRRRRPATRAATARAPPRPR